MAGNFTLYSAAGLSIGSAAFSLGSDNFNSILLTTAYVPSPSTDALYSDISINEVVTGGGYTVGGLPLTGVTWTRSSATSTFSAQSAVWTGVTLSARYVVIVRRASASLAPSDKLLGYVDLTLGGNASATASTFQVNWNNASTPSSANAVFTVVHNP
jgi:hypothetical protein